MKKLLILLCFVSTTLVSQTVNAQERRLTSLENAQDLAQVHASKANISLTSGKGVTDGSHALKVEFTKASYPMVTWEFHPAADWSEYGALEYDVTNLDSDETQIVLKVDDAENGNGTRSTYCEIVIPPGQTYNVYALFTRPERRFEMMGVPPPKGFYPAVTKGREQELQHIYSFSFFIRRPAKPYTLVIDNIRLVKEYRPEGVSDLYGQSSQGDWPGKIKQDKELLRANEEELAILAKEPRSKHFDEYGGWLEGPHLKATGHFRTTKVGDKWWFVTPMGHLFFLIGVGTVHMGDYTYTAGREWLFQKIPNDEVYGKFQRDINKRAAYNFYQANLRRKYGEGYAQEWEQRTIARFNTWNFNTVCNVGGDSKIVTVPEHPAYTIWVTYKYEKSLKVGSGRAIWDVFDSQWEEKMAEGVLSAYTRFASDPKLIGFYMDNELGWGNAGFDTPERLSRYVLARKGEVPAKKAFVAHLKERYASIQDLNNAWSTNFSSWNLFEEEPAKVPDPSTGTLTKDLEELTRFFAENYYSKVRKAMNKNAPEVLYLGDRYNSHPKAVMEVAAKYCDVVSSNHYERTLEGPNWEFLQSLNKPFLISEFHFGAQDRGMFYPGLVPVADQEARGKAYERYMDSLLDMKVVVGAAWFMYLDKPLTAATSYEETFNSGLVSVADTPFYEMTRIMRRYNGNIYESRGK